MLSIIELVLNLLGTALAAAKANNLTQEVVQGLQAAITALFLTFAGWVRKKRLSTKDGADILFLVAVVTDRMK